MQPFGGMGAPAQQGMGYGQQQQPQQGYGQQQQQQQRMPQQQQQQQQQQYGAAGAFPGQQQPQQQFAPQPAPAAAPVAASAAQTTPNEQRWQAEAACMTKLRAATASMVKDELQAAVDEAKRLNVGGRELQAAQQLLHEFAEVDQRDQRQRDEAMTKASAEERRKQV